MDSLFEDLENEVQFERDQILTDEAIQSLQAYANSGLQGIDYAGYIAQTRSIISTLDSSQLIMQLTAVSTAFTAAGQVSNEILTIIH